MQQFSPIIFFDGTYSPEDIENYKNENRLIKIDLYDQQIKELAQIKNKFRGNKEKSSEFKKKFIEIGQKDKDIKGDWIHFPWTNVLLHQIKKDDFLTLLTDRNMGFVSSDNQESFLKKTICIVGLSTGSSIALGLVHSGIGGTFILSDFDRVDTSDLNRTFYDLSDVGLLKTVTLSRKMYQINPYLDIQLFSKGISEKNAKDIIENKGIDLFFDEASMLTPGVLMRKFAKKFKIPVVTCGNISDGSYLSTERYDLNSNLEPYFGIQKSKLDKYINSENFEKLEKSTLDLMSTRQIDKKTLDIIRNKDHSLTESPQLYTALALNSSFAVYITKQIFLSKKTKEEYFLKHSSC